MKEFDGVNKYPTKDHVVPKCLGGRGKSWGHENIRAACRKCNSLKGPCIWSRPVARLVRAAERFRWYLTGKVYSNDDGSRAWIVVNGVGFVEPVYMVVSDVDVEDVGSIEFYEEHTDGWSIIQQPDFCDIVVAWLRDNWDVFGKERTVLDDVGSLDSLLRLRDSILAERNSSELDDAGDDETAESTETKQTCCLCGFDLGPSFSGGFRICEECATIVRSGTAVTEPIIKLVQKLHATESKYNDLVSKVRRVVETVKLELNDITTD